MWLVEDAMPGDVLAFFCMLLPMLQSVDLKSKIGRSYSRRARDTGP